jgi:glutamate-ammonia-ligase adenylyltransferase
LRAAHDVLTRLLVTLRLVAPDAAPPGHATQELIARAIGVADWPAVVATLESTRQEVRRFWVQVTGEQDG